jgi:tetratricopeptide (TPR) repeat protein
MDHLYSRIQIANLNNEGTSRIAAGDFEGGTECLKAALAVSKTLIRQEQQLQSTRNPTFSLDQMIIFEMKGMKKDAEDNEDGTFVVRDPIRISESSPFLAEAESSQMLGTVVVFNLGLATHLAALKQLSQADELRKATHLYECAFNLQTLNLQNSNNTVFVSTVLHLAIINNLAHAHYVRGNKARADDCYQHLLSTLMYVVDTDQIATPSASEIIRCCFRSTYHLIFSAQMQPAAAA